MSLPTCLLTALITNQEKDDSTTLEELKAHKNKSYPAVFVSDYRINGSTLLAACRAFKISTALFILSPNSRFARYVDEDDGITPLHAAAGTGSISLVQAIYKAYPFAIDRTTKLQRRTPLFFAVQAVTNPDIEDPMTVIKFLLSSGAVPTFDVTMFLTDELATDPELKRPYTRKLQKVRKLFANLENTHSAV